MTKLIIGRNEVDLNLLISYFIMNKVVVNFDMFSVDIKKINLIDR